MHTDHTATRECLSRVRSAVRSKFLRPLVLSGLFAACSIGTATRAAAHVKWFVNCNVSDATLPLYAVFTPTFFQYLGLFLSLFTFACIAERTALGSLILGLLDRCTAPLHRRADDLLRAATAISFALLWADGTIILTPELKASSMALSAIQLLIPIYLFNRATVPAAGVGIIVLYGYGVATYGLFHMLDYPVFIGLGIFFLLSVSRSVKLLAWRSHILRWTCALSLLWPAMEKFLYPSWIAAIAIVHPELTLGFPVAMVITTAGIVEFGLSFALLWTPLPRRLAALGFIMLLTSATLDFGKVDGIGHMLIVVILLVIASDPEGKPQQSHPALAPLVSSLALVATIFLYAGGHMLYYGPKSASIAPLISGLALLVFIVLCLQGLPQAWFQIAAALWRQLLISTSSNARYRHPPRTSRTTAWARQHDVVAQHRRRSAMTAGLTATALTMTGLTTTGLATKGLATTKLARRTSLSNADRNGSRAHVDWGLHPEAADRSAESLWRVSEPT